MPKKIKFMFEYSSDWCLWSDEGLTSPEQFNLSPELVAEMEALSKEFDSSLNWNYPPDPSPWSAMQKRDFDRRALDAYKKVAEELNGEYLVERVPPRYGDENTRSEELKNKALDLTEKMKRTLSAIGWIEFILYFVVVILVFKFDLHYLSLIFFIVFFKVLEYLVKRLFKKKIVETSTKIIEDELDPEKFYEFFRAYLGMGQQGSPFTLVLILHWLGDYQTSIAIVKRLYSNEKFRKNKEYRFSYYMRLLLLYFDMGDIESLKEILAKANAEEPIKGRNERYNENLLKTMGYFNKFANGQYEECVSLCEEYYAFNKDTPISKRQILTWEHFWAVALYKLSRTDEARVHFEKILSIGPKMSLANIAERYIKAIDEGVEYEPKKTKPVDEELMQWLFPSNDVVAKARKGKLLIYAITFIIIIFIVIMLRHLIA